MAKKKVDSLEKLEKIEKVVNIPDCPRQYAAFFGLTTQEIAECAKGPSSFPWEIEFFSAPIGEVAARLVKLRELYPQYDDIVFNVHSYYEDTYLDIHGIRLETDAEFEDRKARILKEEEAMAMDRKRISALKRKKKEAQKQKDYEQFLKLKKQFEPEEKV